MIERSSVKSLAVTTKSLEFVTYKSRWIVSRYHGQQLLTSNGNSNQITVALIEN